MALSLALSEFAIRDHQAVMWNLYKSEEGSDLTLICASSEFRVHSYMLTMRSTWFTAACDGNFKDCATKRLYIYGSNPGQVERMIQYCYTMGYCEELLNNDDDRYSYISRTHTNAEMYAMGHKYGIAGLKATAAVKFEATLVIEYGLTLLDPNTLVATELIALIAIVYGGTPESDRRLRDQVIPKIQVYWATLAAMGDFRSLISRYPEFMLDMVNASRS